MLKNKSEMDIINIETICVPIIVGIMSIAYPILGDKKNKIGEKYKANFLLNVFESFGPQKRALNNKFSYFEIWLLLTIISFIFLIISLPPLSIFRSCPIFYLLLGYSAKFITLVLTVGTVYQFVRWNNNIMIYTGKVTGILSKVLYKYENIADTDTQLKNYCLNTINSFTIYAIKNGEEHLQKTLLNFYYKEFRNVRLNTERGKEKEKEEVVFPTELYFLIYNVIDSSLTLNKQYLSAIENRAVSGKWLFGEMGETVNLSEQTYMWLWRYVILMRNNNKMLSSLWTTSNQVLGYQMKMPTPTYAYNIVNSESIVENKDDISRISIQRKRFKEFFIGLGGLMLSQKNYFFIKYMFTFSQSTPPSYYLLPNSINEIFEWYDFILNDFENIEQAIEHRYWFPEYDNLGNSHQVKDEMCKYLALVFIRQFTLVRRYIYTDLLAFDFQETNISKLNFLLSNLYDFEKLILKNLENKELLEFLDFDVEKDDVLDKIKDIKAVISNKIESLRVNTELSSEKIKEFKSTSKKMIESVFNQYKLVSNQNNPISIDISRTSSIVGTRSLFSKSAFVDNDIPVLNFDSVLASGLINNVKTYIPNAFSIASTQDYVLVPDKVVKAIDLIIPDVNNKIIIGVNLDWICLDLLNKSKYLDIFYQIPSTSRMLSNSLFVLDRKDLPYISFEDILPSIEEELSDSSISIEQLELDKLSDELKLFASVVDINKSDRKKLKEFYQISDSEELNVLVTILFKCVIKWNEQRSIVRIDIVSQFNEKGIPNDISDIQPL